MDWAAGKGAGCCKPVTLEAGIDGLSSGAKSGLKSRHSAALFTETQEDCANGRSQLTYPMAFQTPLRY